MQRECLTYVGGTLDTSLILRHAKQVELRTLWGRGISSSPAAEADVPTMSLVLVGGDGRVYRPDRDGT